MPFQTEKLKDFLEFIWGVREKRVLDLKNEHDLAIINGITKSTEFSESLVHLEFSDNLVTIWRPADWRSCYQKFLLDKEKAEIRNAQSDKDKECEVYLKELILQKLGAIAGADMADTLARDIVKNRKTTSALMFGATKEKLSWTTS